MEEEHKEFIKDTTSLALSFTPLSNLISVLRYGKKWSARVIEKLGFNW